MEQSGMITNNKVLPIAGIGTENLSIELTTRCTNECSHCFARAGRIDSPELSFDTAQGIIAEGFRIGYRHLHLTGGEPLLWPHLFGLLDGAASLGYEMLFINTNGTLLTPDTARRLAGFGERLHLSISLQGPEQIHDRFRGPGSFQKATQGARNSLDAALSVFIFATVGKSLVAVLPRFAEYVFTELPGVKGLTLIQLIRVAGRSVSEGFKPLANGTDDAHGLDRELLAPEDFVGMVRSAALLNLYGYPVTVLENPLATVAADLMEMPWLPPEPMLYRNGKIVVMADRSITLAHSSRETYGAYAPGALSAVLMSEDYARAVSPDTVTCPYCRFRSACAEKGMVRPSEWFRDRDGSAPYCKRVLRLIA
ncbi:MAG: hypothetical protein A2W19_00935 [Spirochaetes bacterium RBG_16_49_21]|nr:MAG: hypothetical protein A2W19_00935 [Spirochaetes bacterium RBG_16_49_21]